MSKPFISLGPIGLNWCHRENPQKWRLPPGEILRDVLADAGLTANAAALKMRIPGNRLTAILNGQRAITAGTALRQGVA